MRALLYVPAAGLVQARIAQQASGNDQMFQLEVRPLHARIESNNYAEADELELTWSYDESPLDPRILRACEIYFYLGDTFGGRQLDETDMRFVGIARDVTRNFSLEPGKRMKVKFHDYTCLFLEAKSYPSAGVPRLSDSIQKAWETICDNTGYWDMQEGKVVSTVQILKNKLVAWGNTDLSLTLGETMPERLRRLGRVELHGATDAWAVWQRCIQPLGLISFIRGDRCVVTTATDYFTADDPPRFVWGQNILELEESRDQGTLSSKNLCLRSLDPLAKKTLESFYPPLSDPDIVKKKVGASAKKAPESVHAQDYECFDLPFTVADQATLDRLAQCAWEVRSRQELRGKLTTVEMSIATAKLPTSQIFDMLSLQAGDQIQVEIDRNVLDLIQKQPSIGARAQALRAKGYSDDAADFIAENLDSITSQACQFLVHRVTTEIDASMAGDGVSYKTEIEFLNRIDLAGAALNQAQGTDQPPMQGQKTAE